MIEQYYKRFEYHYNNDDLLNLYYNSTEYIKKFPWQHADHEIVSKNSNLLPMNWIFKRTLSLDEFGLSCMIDRTGFHTSPRNNGLIIFPLEKNLKVDFENNISVIIDSPTMINGRQFHDWYPLEDKAIFYAIKIPSSIVWEDACKLVENECCLQNSLKSSK